MEEKRKLKVHRWVWFVIVLALVFIPIISNATQPELAITDESVYINNYYEYLNETSVDIYITFNRDVSYGGYATIRYYDASNRLLESKRTYFYGSGKTVESEYTTINGKVDSYEIVSFEFSPTTINALTLFCWSNLIIAIPFFIGSLTLNYKEYDYNGKILSVYAGWFHHTLRIDGVLLDEHNTLISFVHIILSATTEDGTSLEATVTTFNRISLKADNKLLSNKK